MKSACTQRKMKGTYGGLLERLKSRASARAYWVLFFPRSVYPDVPFIVMHKKLLWQAATNSPDFASKAACIVRRRSWTQTRGPSPEKRHLKRSILSVSPPFQTRFSTRSSHICLRYKSSQTRTNQTITRSITPDASRYLHSRRPVDPCGDSSCPISGNALNSIT